MTTFPFVAYATVLTPMLATLIAIWYVADNLSICAALVSLVATLYLLTSLGLTAGFHRLYTHRSYQASRLLRNGLGILGSMAAQGPLIYWVGSHRSHHQHSDVAGKDPHTPQEYGEGLVNALRGLWHAHMGWMLSVQPVQYFRQCPDLLRDADARFVSKFYWCWVGLGIIVPGILLQTAYPSVSNAWLQGMLWGGFVRIALVHHSTWGVNSICHTLGYQSHCTRDNSRNNFVIAFLTLGEGWHNNHHAFPSSARHGLRWWEIDLTYTFIRLCEKLGAASSIVDSPNRTSPKT